jgi:ATP-dependent Clp protease protease subunit
MCVAALLVLATSAGAVWAQAAQTSPAAPAAAAVPMDPELAALKLKLDRLQTEAKLREMQLEAEVSALKAENARLKTAAELAATKQLSELQPQALQQQRLDMEGQLQQKKLQAELAAVKAENERLKAAADLAAAKQQAQLQPMTQQKTQLETEAALNKLKRDADRAPVASQLEMLQQQQQLRDAQLAADLAELKAKTARLTAQAELDAAQGRADLAKVAAKNALETETLRSQSLEAQASMALEASEFAAIQAKVKKRDSDQEWKDAVNADIDYRNQPFVDGVLYISDRRIDMDGPIISGVADYVCNRIDYYNNQSHEDPIFLVIDNCPGGSVMEGYRIVKAIESSKAPVNVIVKSFAASMAAVIATLTPHSYAYPNAIILHHQMSSMMWGNMTDLEQQVETVKEWERRLHEPVAKKMGISIAEFKKRMYEAKKSGDWVEFADQAQKLKWVDDIVQEIREEGVRKKPSDEFPKPWWWRLFAKDDQGQTYVNLPPPAPMDAYMLYNPNRFYRVDGR